MLIDGAAGTGKSDLAKYLVKSKNRQVKLVKKYTTRKQRKEEFTNISSDLHFPPDSQSKFEKRKQDGEFFWYHYGNKETGEHLYGIYINDILQALEEVDFAVAIIRGSQVIEDIKNSLSNIRCVSVFIYTDKELVQERLIGDGYDKKAVEFRLSRLPLAWGDYIKGASQYDETIINSSNSTDFELIIERLFQKFKKSNQDSLIVDNTKELPLLRPLIGFRKAMEERLEKYSYEKNVFLMMKFRNENARLYAYIKTTLEKQGLNCVRADNPEWDITRNTYNPIAALYCCKFGIALFDEPEPKNEYSANVAYELGVMHNQLKECLVLRHTSLVSAPFDLVKELYVDYSDNLELENIITDWIGKLPRY